jgi:hypothetical protein
MHGLTAGYGSQMHVDMLNRWQKPGDITDVPRLDEDNTEVNQFSTRFLYKGDYLRLRNITFSYDLTGIVSRNFISASRIFIQADNYLTWSKLKKGADPEVNVDGTTRNTSSPFKIFSAGLEISF